MKPLRDARGADSTSSSGHAIVQQSTKRGSRRLLAAAEKDSNFRGNHLSKTTCLTQVFFNSGESYGNA